MGRPFLISNLGYWYVSWVGQTSSIYRIREEIRRRLEQSYGGFIYAFWHGRQLLMPYLHAHDQAHTLISLSKDGDQIARIAQRFGIRVVRGSSSRGGVRALVTMKRLLAQGQRVAMTPDGPRGPQGVVQPGILFLAQKTSCPIVPIAYGVKRRMIVRGWDEYVVPFPFNRITMVYGEPLMVSPHDSLEAKREELARALHQVTTEADQLARNGR
ncbi:MAG: lysophospholipid acyltransferase family protein [Elusimicrobia bacterium]|nr:lysophospholipid acyltransferase family protein [Elusimicrobiota bacterium]